MVREISPDTRQPHDGTKAGKSHRTGWRAGAGGGRQIAKGLNLQTGTQCNIVTLRGAFTGEMGQPVLAEELPWENVYAARFFGKPNAGRISSGLG